MGADRSLPEEPQERGEVGQGRALQVEGRRGGHGQEIRRGERKEWGTPTPVGSQWQQQDHPQEWIFHFHISTFHVENSVRMVLRIQQLYLHRRGRRQPMPQVQGCAGAERQLKGSLVVLGFNVSFGLIWSQQGPGWIQPAKSCLAWVCGLGGGTAPCRVETIELVRFFWVTSFAVWWWMVGPPCCHFGSSAIGAGRAQLIFWIPHPPTHEAAERQPCGVGIQCQFWIDMKPAGTWLNPTSEKLPCVSLWVGWWHSSLSACLNRYQFK